MFDFETIKNRRLTNASKWLTMKETTDFIVPMNVADMEFVTPEVIKKALHSAIEEMSPYGYQKVDRDYFQALQNWMKKHHQLDVEMEQLEITQGVVEALNQCVKKFTQPNQGVIILTPVYPPFFSVASCNDTQVVECPLINEKETYRVDFELFEKQCSDPNNTLLLLCSPHNPIGKVFSKHELTQIGEICLKHHVLVVVDEIHQDLVFTKHTCFPTISEAFKQNCILCTAPSKTFNLAGLMTSNIFIFNPKLHQQYQTRQKLSINPLSMKAITAAYNGCEEWLEECLKVIYQNYQCVKEILSELPVEIAPLEGTYLMWVNMNGLGFEESELTRLLQDECHSYFNVGSSFGQQGRGYVRINLATPKSCLVHTISKIVDIMKKTAKN